MTGRIKELSGIALILLLAAGVIHLFRIEYLSGFDQYFPFIAGVVFLHNLFPYRLRDCLFPFWTFALLLLSAGVTIASGVLGIIFLAVAITFIPQKGFRNFSAFLLFTGMIALRILFHNEGIAGTIITVGGIFIMLRFIFLLYEISFMKVKPSFLLRVNYLFMLPNIFFPLFPVVDPLVFFKHREEDAAEANTQGKSWLARGILHLLFYRFIYLYIAPSIYELHSWFDLLTFILCGYSLILRLSGIFYLSGGILGLMGYKLPPVFENYFLVRNFRDLWRRINLYWRHFMWRVFYYPMIFKLKRWPQKRAVLFTVLVMFGVTWLLHGWQWYWVKGFFPIVPNDILYWSLFGIILAYVSVRAFSKDKNNLAASPFMNGIGIVSMFFAMSLLWSLWTASSLTEWLYIMSKFSKLDLRDSIFLISSVIGIFLFGGILSVLQDKINLFGFFVREPRKEMKFIFLALLIGTGIIYKTGNHLSDYPFSKIVDPQLNSFDRMIVERGYYEQLLTTPKISQEINSLFTKPEQKDFQNPAYEKATGLLPKKIKPSFSTVFKGKLFTTNCFGMRDRAYPLQPDPGVYRICLLGGSYEMGSGVADGEPYEQLMEDSLNRSGIKTEILNMGVGGYSLLQMVKMADSNCAQYSPNAIAFVSHSSEKQRMIESILDLVARNSDPEYPYLKKVIRESGIASKKMCRAEMYDRLLPYSDSLLHWAFHQMAESCRQFHNQSVWIYLPAIGDLRADDDLATCKAIAQSEGFQVIDLSNVYNGFDNNKITVSDEDTHPNELGHQLIAHELFPEIRKKIERDNAEFIPAKKE